MSGLLLIGVLTAAVVFVVFATARWNLHPFLVLLAASYGVGMLSGLSAAGTVDAITDGFGGTIGYIGIVIAAGTIIGAVLERTGGARVLADAVVRVVGRTRSLLAMSITGAVVSVPVFCDSGFIILSPLSRSLARESGDPLASYAVGLSMGLYATHVFIPPTPGPIAAAGELGAELGFVILLGLVVIVPVLISTYMFARFMGERIDIGPPQEETLSGEIDQREGAMDRSDATVPQITSVTAAALPIAIPIVLIALQSIAALPSRPLGESTLFTMLTSLGNPNTALLLGVVVAFVVTPNVNGRVFSEWAGQALKDGGIIILITGAGGAFGAVLQATPIGDYLAEALAGYNMGALSILLPFILASALKTTLGSSTVAMITAAAISMPLLPSLGLDGTLGPVLTTLAIGAGAMTVSHANDSYFWVVSQFSGMTVPQAYRLQTLGSAVAGITGIATIFVLALVLL